MARRVTQKPIRGRKLRKMKMVKMVIRKNKRRKKKKDENEDFIMRVGRISMRSIQLSVRAYFYVN